MTNWFKEASSRIELKGGGFLRHIQIKNYYIYGITVNQLSEFDNRVLGSNH